MPEYALTRCGEGARRDRFQKKCIQPVLVHAVPLPSIEFRLVQNPAQANQAQIDGSILASRRVMRTPRRVGMEAKTPSCVCTHDAAESSG
ncbi:hypothetical protein XEULMG905_00335 [Xanthomonas euvesicatoria]|nr:hypothetical protein XEULMG905_00335 [Xanthomonas euvesicatoria]